MAVTNTPDPQGPPVTHEDFMHLASIPGESALNFAKTYKMMKMIVGGSRISHQIECFSTGALASTEGTLTVKAFQDTIITNIRLKAVDLSLHTIHIKKGDTQLFPHGLKMKSLTGYDAVFCDQFEIPPGGWITIRKDEEIDLIFTTGSTDTIKGAITFMKT